MDLDRELGIVLAADLLTDLVAHVLGLEGLCFNFLCLAHQLRSQVPATGTGATAIRWKRSTAWPSMNGVERTCCILARERWLRRDAGGRACPGPDSHLRIVLRMCLEPGGCGPQ